MNISNKNILILLMKILIHRMLNQKFKRNKEKIKKEL